MLSIKILNNFSDGIFNQKFIEFDGILFNGLDNYKLNDCEYILIAYNKKKINSIYPILYNGNKYIIFCRFDPSNNMKGFYIEINNIKKLRLEFEDSRTIFNCNFNQNNCLENFNNFIEYNKEDFIIYNLIDNLD